MFHVGGHQGSRGRSTGISKSSSGIYNKTDWKSPLRCGIQFCTLSLILFVVGVVLTCLGIHDVFGETVPITGPILLTVGALFLILASRQFFLSRTRKKFKASLKEKEAKDGKKTMVVDADDGTGASTILMEHANEHGIREKDGFGDDEDHQIKMEEGMHDLKAPNSPSFEPGTYIWPSSTPYQPSPFTCVSLMLGKDPAMLLASQGFLGGYSPGTMSTGLSPSPRPLNGLSPISPIADSNMLQEPFPSSSTASASTSNLSPTHQITPGTVAVIAEAAASAASSSEALDEPVHPNDKPKLSATLSPGGLPAMIAREGISNFPNRTAIMMLKTLELQETI